MWRCAKMSTNSQRTGVQKRSKCTGGVARRPAGVTAGSWSFRDSARPAAVLTHVRVQSSGRVLDEGGVSTRGGNMSQDSPPQASHAGQAFGRSARLIHTGRAEKWGKWAGISLQGSPGAPGYAVLRLGPTVISARQSSSSHRSLSWEQRGCLGV